MSELKLPASQQTISKHSIDLRHIFFLFAGLYFDQEPLKN